MGILIKIDSLFEFSNYSSRAELNITKAFERTEILALFEKSAVIEFNMQYSPSIYKFVFIL